MNRGTLSLALLALIAGGCGSEDFDSTDVDGASDESEEVDETAVALNASSRPGMGAIPYNGGVTFRVWAPGAQRVWVTGDWNGWSTTADELGNEFNGNFSGDFGYATRWQKYQYVIQTAWGEKIWKSDPRATRVERSNGASIIHDPGYFQWTDGGYQIPAWNEMVIYEMHAGTFHDSPGGGPGNWGSAKAKLDHLRDLGVNVIELLPVGEFPGDFSWGYNPSFPYAPETAYGTPDDLKSFVNEAHRRGISVIVDVVHNHYGPSDLPMWCFTGDCMGNGGHYFYTDWRASTPWGNTRPDYGRNEVRDYIKDSIHWWLNEYHLDGIRFDATKYIRTTDGGTSLPQGFSLLQYVNNSIDGTQPWKISIAEDFGGGDSITKPTSQGGAGFDAQWDGSFVHPVRDAMTAQSDAGRDMNAVKNAITHGFNGSAFQRVIYTESHDECANGKTRVPEAIWAGNAGGWHAKKRSTLGAALVMTSPGIPMIFQGQELLEDGWWADTDPVDWNKAGYFPGIVTMYRDLIRLRRNWFNNTRGLAGNNVNVHHVNNSGKVLAFHRWKNGGGGDDVVVLANFSGTTYTNYNVGMPRSGMWRVRFNSDWNGYSPDFANTTTVDTNANGSGRDGMGQSANITIGAYSVVILSQ
ncbi:alpha-amylase family glycosyl hydrolase [Chondromyces apiculatus]|uniref:1,4-alpha-glucan branching enzyme n=1 Tax=Chondromyces apiculatus DSM 436 TaxID=1192034 RepID=A0A017T8B0_9BACT|nr:alpha-amylase family glycosyl hydrolase [Chondromyces apiculatus]EYF05207.1 Malto-oligosyltrehalose trehalohydrolase [Chondromyces apiculatus DSM 436]